MISYFDGFILPLPKEMADDCRAVAEKAGALWKEHGALTYFESVLDDPESMDMVDFPALAKADTDETVVFAWILFESREHRDAVNAKFMADLRMKQMMKQGDDPVEHKRMVY